MCAVFASSKYSVIKGEGEHSMYCAIQYITQDICESCCCAFLKFSIRTSKKYNLTMKYKLVACLLVLLSRIKDLVKSSVSSRVPKKESNPQRDTISQFLHFTMSHVVLSIQTWQKHAVTCQNCNNFSSTRSFSGSSARTVS